MGEWLSEWQVTKVMERHGNKARVEMVSRDVFLATKINIYG